MDMSVFRAQGRTIRAIALHGRDTFYGALNDRVFPFVIAYASNPLTILATLGLLVPLILWATNTSLILVVNSYLNVCSAAVSSIVLLQQVAHHRENKKLHDDHRQQIAALHELVKAQTPPVAPPTHTPTASATASATASSKPRRPRSPAPASPAPRV